MHQVLECRPLSVVRPHMVHLDAGFNEHTAKKYSLILDYTKKIICKGKKKGPELRIRSFQA